jgi:hypothetical protein
MESVRVACLSAAAVLLLGACTGTPDTTAGSTPETSPTPTETPEEEEEVVTPEPPPRITVPDVVGGKLPQARTVLKRVGLVVRVNRKASDQPPGSVLAQRPLAGLDVREGRSVQLLVAKPKPPPPPPPSGGGGGDCHPSYTGACLDPNASDYDCAGGSGDGPKYTGQVNVVGPDEYGLDGDGDGVGCE